MSSALGRETETRFIVGPHEQPLDLEATAQYLSGLPKPVSCSATGSNANAIRVSCLPGKSERTMLGLTSATPVLAAKSKTTGEADVLLIGAGESIRLTAQALERWTNDYAITLPFGISGDDPTPEHRAAQIRWVLRVGPGAIVSTSVQDFQLSPEMADIIGEEFERVRREFE
ncbi:MAG TPA: hypothetical protein VGD49_12780 [Longimicrobiales bacterium]